LCITELDLELLTKLSVVNGKNYKIAEALEKILRIEKLIY